MGDPEFGMSVNASERRGLRDLLAQAEAENWCTKWGCTTCGSRELREGLEQLASVHGSVGEIIALAGSEPDFPWSDGHVFALRWLAHRSDGELTGLLKGSPAGDLYATMLRAKQSGDRSRSEHAARKDPAYVAAERARKKAERAAMHKARLEAKEQRDMARLIDLGDDKKERG